MLDHPTLDQLKTLRLDGMAEAFAKMQSQDGTAVNGGVKTSQVAAQKSATVDMACLSAV